jgi:hypothetical protein
MVDFGASIEDNSKHELTLRFYCILDVQEFHMAFNIFQCVHRVSPQNVQPIFVYHPHAWKRLWVTAAAALRTLKCVIRHAKFLYF